MVRLLRCIHWSIIKNLWKFIKEFEAFFKMDNMISNEARMVESMDIKKVLRSIL